MTTTINAASAGLVSTADSSTALALQTAGTTSITIDSSQRVGIGNTTPNTALGVTGAIYASGNISGSNISAGLAKNTQVFTTGSAATYTAPANTNWLKVTVVGPGGNGGASAAGRATGGGGGGVAIKWLAITAGQTLTYTVGTASGTASAVSSGTATITTITANSGTNGTATAYAASITAGGAGGTAVNGDVNITGGQGGYSYGSSTTLITNFSGQGGDCPGFGTGGPALALVANAGVAGNGFGAGASGAIGNAANAAGTGGVIIFEAF